jgi:hypothetical protein
MCFAPPRHAHFQHLNFKKCSEPGQRLTLLTLKCASSHNGVHFFNISTSKSGPDLVCFAHFDLEMCFAPQGVQFFISHLASGLCTRRFSKPTFPQIIGKTQCFATFLPFRTPGSSFF